MYSTQELIETWVCRLHILDLQKLSTNEPSAKEQERRKDFAVYQKEFFSQQTLDAFQKNPFGGDANGNLQNVEMAMECFSRW